MIRAAAFVAGAALVCGLLAGCGVGQRTGAADKAGGSSAPRVLRLATPWDSSLPDAPTLRYFAKTVETLSHGRLRVQIVFQAAGRTRPDVEPRVAQMVRDGKFELGWIGARAWDELGVKSFQALQAPFLITTDRLLDAVAESPLPGRMLPGLADAGVIGLALVPDLLRHPIGLRRPFVSLADFRGARIRSFPSGAGDALLRALGATPVPLALDDVHAAMAQHRIDAQDLALLPLGVSFATGNLVFYPRFDTLFADRDAIDALPGSDRALLLEAVRRARDFAIASRTPDPTLAHDFCAAGGRVVLASDQDLEALRRAANPVYFELEQDPETRDLIAAIRALARSTPSGPPVRACAPANAPPPPVAAPAMLEGTYRWVLTKADARAHAPPGENLEGYPLVFTVVLNDGRWADDQGETGTYTVRGNRLVLDWPAVNTVLTFTFTRDADGTLHVAAVPPIEAGDRFVWTTEPWQRIGPP